MNDLKGPFWRQSIQAVMVLTFIDREENEMKRFQGRAVLMMGAGSGTGEACADCIRKVPS